MEKDEFRKFRMVRPHKVLRMFLRKTEANMLPHLLEVRPHLPEVRPHLPEVRPHLQKKNSKNIVVLPHLHKVRPHHV